MIGMLIGHPLAAVAAVLSVLGEAYGYQYTGNGEPPTELFWVTLIGVYLVGYVVLPKWPRKKRVQ